MMDERESVVKEVHSVPLLRFLQWVVPMKIARTRRFLRQDPREAQRGQ